MGETVELMLGRSCTGDNHACRCRELRQCPEGQVEPLVVFEAPYAEDGSDTLDRSGEPFEDRLLGDAVGHDAHILRTKTVRKIVND